MTTARERTKYIIPLILLVLCTSIIVFHRYLFDGYYLLHSDLLRANLPTYYHMYDSIFLGQSGFWSWRMGIGTSMFSHADVYFDPFTYIVFLGGRANIPAMFVWLLIIKVIFEALSFFTYITYFDIDKRAAVIASFCYAFSGYSLVVGNNFALGTILVYFPLVCLGIEKWLHDDSIRLLAVSLFLIAVCNLYYFYITGLLTAVYIIYRTAWAKKLQKLPLYLLKLAELGLFAVLLSAFSLLPQLSLMTNSSRVKTPTEFQTGLFLFVPQIRTLVTALIRLIGLNLLRSSQQGYIGLANGIRDELDLATFISLFFFIILFQYLYYKKSDRRIVIQVILGCFVFTLIPFFSYASNAFSTINMRWMFIVPLLCSVVIAMGIQQILQNGIHLPSFFFSVLFSYILVFIGISILTYQDESGCVKKALDVLGGSWIYYTVSLILFFVLFLYIVFEKKNRSGIFLFIISALMIIDACLNHLYLYDNDKYLVDYSEDSECCYMDSSAEVIRAIMDKDRDFYRINKDFDSVVDYLGLESLNDAMVQGYYGLKNYNSLCNPNYQAFLKKSGIYLTAGPSLATLEDQGIDPEDVIGQQTNYINGVPNRYLLMSYLGVKYNITKKSDPNLPYYFNKISSVNGIGIYENAICYPLAFVNESLMSEDQFAKLSKEEKDRALLNCTIVKNQVKDIDMDSIEAVDPFLLASQRQAAFALESFQSDRISFDIECNTDNSYLSFTMPYDDDWHIYVDGVENDKVMINIGLLGTMIGKGAHRIDLVYSPKMFNLGIAVAFITALGLIIYCLYKKHIKKAAEVRE
jgi:uncharacterized membrane protein YfhO